MLFSTRIWTVWLINADYICLKRSSTSAIFTKDKTGWSCLQPSGTKLTKIWPGVSHMCYFVDDQSVKCSSPFVFQSSFWLMHALKYQIDISARNNCWQSFLHFCSCKIEIDIICCQFKTLFGIGVFKLKGRNVLLGSSFFLIKKGDWRG